MLAVSLLGLVEMVIFFVVVVILLVEGVIFFVEAVIFPAPVVGLVLATAVLPVFDMLCLASGRACPMLRYRNSNWGDKDFAWHNAKPLVVLIAELMLAGYDWESATEPASGKGWPMW
jgi:hypothetical protein